MEANHKPENLEFVNYESIVNISEENDAEEFDFDFDYDPNEMYYELAARNR
ncbi:hypothetical protein [Flavobacterium sp. 3HN19-14]|uniref:hypothetical protein n=1 Tax=Flavobacterium sp. 3HN19-14 TaxID=3448133 RepID=UPI003EE1C556